MAISIMSYHFVSWKIAVISAQYPLGKLGIYAVSTFFILSGICLSIVYDSSISTINGVIKFIIKRVFRILPLLWIATTLVIIFLLIKKDPIPSIWILFLNYSTFFGFIKPTAYLTTGAWSIGNEMVFYFIMPLIIYLYHKKIFWGNLFVACSWICGTFFAFLFLHRNQTLTSQWAIYINPFNQLFLFASGVFLYYNFKTLLINTFFNFVSILLLGLVFCLYPIHGDGIIIVTGINRLFFSLICILFVLLFWKLCIKLPRSLESILNSFGIATYSVYLLHPFVLTGATIGFRRLGITNAFCIILFAMILTICLSLYVYKYYEVPFMHFGKHLAKKVNLN